MIETLRGLLLLLLLLALLLLLLLPLLLLLRLLRLRCPGPAQPSPRLLVRLLNCLAPPLFARLCPPTLLLLLLVLLLLLLLLPRPSFLQACPAPGVCPGVSTRQVCSALLTLRLPTAGRQLWSVGQGAVCCCWRCCCCCHFPWPAAWAQLWGCWDGAEDEDRGIWPGDERRRCRAEASALHQGISQAGLALLLQRCCPCRPRTAPPAAWPTLRALGTPCPG